MADRFHFNPTTGRTGRCDAKSSGSCRFGQSEAQHGSNGAEARANYEGTMVGELFTNTSKRNVPEPKLATPAEIFALLADTEPRLSSLRRQDLSFLRGLQLSDSLYDLEVKSARATDFSVDRESLSEDGTLGLRVGLELSLRNRGGIEFEDERATLWIVTDGVDTEISFADTAGLEDIQLKLEDVGGIIEAAKR